MQDLQKYLAYKPGESAHANDDLDIDSESDDTDDSDGEKQVFIKSSTGANRLKDPFFGESKQSDDNERAFVDQHVGLSSLQQ